MQPITLSPKLVALCKRQGRKGPGQGGTSLSIIVPPQSLRELDGPAQFSIPAWFVAALDASRRLAAATTA